MKQKYRLLVLVVFLLPIFGVSRAQYVGTLGSANIYLPGAYLEIGINNVGAFGAAELTGGFSYSVPAGYYPYPSGPLAEVYDYGHDGWTVGSPAYYGDYTYPGSPFEGWELQIAGVNSQAFTNGIPATISTFGGGDLTGNNISYVSAGGQLIGNWSGTASGGNLTVDMETEIDTMGNTVNVTVIMRNISTTTPVSNIYYMRSCDPDNDEAHGGSFATNNTIVHQNELPDHAVEVDAEGMLYDDHWSLCTKDCRAVAFIYESWPLSSSTDLGTVWNETYGTGGGFFGGAQYTLAGTLDGDYAIGLVFNVGTINPGDSAVVAYAYVFNDAYSTIDSAFPDPVLVVDGIPAPNAALPAPTLDTFNSCGLAGVTSIPVNILNATTGTWTWSSWTWSPAIGLASTTGVTNTIDLTAIPPFITYTITGTDSASNGFTCNNKTFYLTVHSCNVLYSNAPCVGDTLQFESRGDSIGATYAWSGPAGFTSTMQNPFRYPATMADTGWYYLNRTIGGVDSLDSTYVVIHYIPNVIATSNAPLCTGATDTLHLYAAPDSSGESFSWTGPNTFTSGLQNPSINGFSALDTGVYQVVVSVAGCKDSITIDIGVVPPPTPPVLSDPTPYCEGAPFVPISVTGLVAGATVLWYPSATGGTGVTTSPIVNTLIPGTTTFYASQAEGSCESNRDSISIQVISTPLAPTVSGQFGYCQYIGPFVPLTVNTAIGGTPLWYTVPALGTPSATEPVIDVSIPGTTYSYVSQVDSGCESPRTPVAIIVDPKPVPPVLTAPVYCMNNTPFPLTATGEGVPLDVFTWYGPGVAATGSAVAPTPPTNVPAVYDYYVTQSITIGTLTCTSDSTLDHVIILTLPAPPLVSNPKYCQFAPSLPLTATGTNLQWYSSGILLDSIPVPPTSAVGNTTWYVTQTNDTLGLACQSDSASITDTIIYLPDFSITPQTPYVCQFDSINLQYTYTGTNLENPAYTWVLPAGAHVVDGTDTTSMPNIVVEFDSVDLNNYVSLTASDDYGFCSSTSTIYINVVQQPYAKSYTNPHVCQGDTTELSLASQSANAYNFVWHIDSNPLSTSSALNIVSSSSNDGGPYKISWSDTGVHVIQLNTFTKEQCASLPSFDTVDVHAVPDAAFTYKTKNGGVCLDDSIYFSAAMYNQNDAYTWAPAHSFDNINTPNAWGRLEESQTVITLTVTDPFGCAASSEMTLDPGSCCTVEFPSAFTPGTTLNYLFRPIMAGYHNFHSFKIANRWGQTIFESAGSNVSWDGTYNGIPQDMGVYYYYVKFDCGGNTVEQKGDVTLIR